MRHPNYFLALFCYLVSIELCVVRSEEIKTEPPKLLEELGDATITFRIVCLADAIGPKEELESFFGHNLEHVFLQEKKNNLDLCVIPNCLVYCPSFHLTGFAIERLIKTRDFVPRDQVLKVVDGRFVPETLHLRPLVDHFSIDLTSVPRRKLTASDDAYERAYFPESFRSLFALHGEFSSTTKFESTTAAMDTVPPPIEFRGLLFNAKATIFAHHCASVSGIDGRVSISGLPSKQPLKIRCFHPIVGDKFRGSLDQTGAIGNVIDPDFNGFLQLKPGLNDFGDLDISQCVNRAVEAILYQR
jgi:hypothetical protein